MEDQSQVFYYMLKKKGTIHIYRHHFFGDFWLLPRKSYLNFFWWNEILFSVGNSCNICKLLLLSCEWSQRGGFNGYCEDPFQLLTYQSLNLDKKIEKYAVPINPGYVRDLTGGQPLTKSEAEKVTYTGSALLKDSSKRGTTSGNSPTPKKRKEACNKESCKEKQKSIIRFVWTKMSSGAVLIDKNCEFGINQAQQMNGSMY